MPLISLDDDEPRWVPTHVNVTVIRARGLRTKGKQGSRYVYTVIQVGKDKYTTGLVEKAQEPEWNEECSFELLPGLLEDQGSSVSAYAPGISSLVLTVMHRVLIGLDVFLGQAVIPLDKAFRDGVCPRNEWIKLHSKVGRKEKERGELMVTVQFTRNNMTASMYDLTVKDKPRSAFGKLKDRVTGKKRGDVESSSAILPGRYAALSSSTSQSLQENGGEGVPVLEDYSDERRSKVKDFFLKGKLRKNSDTRSCSSLASESSMASSAGDPFVPIELCSTPIYSSRVMEPFHTEADGEIKVMTHKRAYSDEASKVTAASRPCPAVENLKGQNSVLSKSTLCINGSHVYSAEPACAKSPGGLPVKRTLLEKCSPLSRSLQNLTRRSEDPQKADGRRWSIDKGKKESEAEASAAQTQAATTSEGKPVLATAPLVVASSGAEGSDKGKKLRKTLFSSGRSDSLPAKTEQACGPQEGRLRGWFASSDVQNKPSCMFPGDWTHFCCFVISLGVSPKVESSPDPSYPLPPCFPGPTPDMPPLVTATGQMSPPSAINHTNPFTHPSPPPTSISPSNPFLTRLQRNPFFEDLIAEEALKSPTEMSSYPSFPHGHYPGFLTRTGRSSPSSEGSPCRMSSIKRERPRSVARQRSLPALIPGTQEAAIVNANDVNANLSRPVSENGGEADDFDAFATSRLKSPVGTPTRPPSASFSSSLPSHNPMEQSDFQTIDGTMIDNANQASPINWDLPPLPPRKLTRTPFASRERPSDSWLDRGQELAVQKEASVLFQTDLASLQHIKETNAQVSSVNKESIMYCAALEQNINLCPPSLTPQMPTDGNLNVLKVGKESFLSEGGISPNLIRSPACEPVPNGPAFVLAGNVTPNSSQNCKYVGAQRSTESDRTVPNTPYCLSDCDTTVSESLCSSFQTFPKPESSCEVSSKPKTTFEQWDDNIATSGDITACALPTRDSNNNTNDTSQFAFIDSDNSLSDVIQGTFGVANNSKDSNKALLQCQDTSVYVPSGDEFSVCRSSPGIPKDLINRMTTELETIDDDKYIQLQQAHLVFEGPCASLEGCDTNKTHPTERVKDLEDVPHHLPLEPNLRAESAGSGYKDSFVAPQTASALNDDDGSAMAQPKPEAAHHNAGLDSAHVGGVCLSNDDLKTGSSVLETEEKDSKVPVSETRKSYLTHANNLSFEEFHAQVAPRISRSPSKAKTEVRSARIRTSSTTNSPKTDSRTIPFTASPEGNSPKSLRDSASSFSRPPADTVSDPISVLDPIADLDSELTTLTYPTTMRPGLGSPAATAHSSSFTAQPQVAAQHTFSPEEAQPASSLPPPEESSPHPVKPLTNTAAQGEKKSEGRSVLEKIRSSIHPGRSSQQSTTEPEKTQEVYMSEARAHYQTLTNMELIALLLQQEIEAERQREESELQATLLEKREAELKKMKVQVRDLEDYIDKLLVRIMEQTPTLLQVRARPK